MVFLPYGLYHKEKWLCFCTELMVFQNILTMFHYFTARIVGTLLLRSSCMRSLLDILHLIMGKLEVNYIYSIRTWSTAYYCTIMYHKTTYPRPPNINLNRGSGSPCYVMKSSEEHFQGWISFFSKKIVGTSNMSLEQGQCLYLMGKPFFPSEKVSRLFY